MQLQKGPGTLFDFAYFRKNQHTEDECAVYTDEKPVYRESWDVYQGNFATPQIYCIFLTKNLIS